MLTDAIKQHVLDHRIYHPEPSRGSRQPPANNQNIVNQQINNIHCVQNFVSGMSPLDKIKAFCDYKDLESVNFEDALGDRYKKVVERFGQE